MSMTSDDWSSELRLLRDRGVSLGPGLTATELDRVEEVHGFRFPPDLRSFLSCAMPQGKGFLDWRAPASGELIKRLAWPFDGIAFDIEHANFWWPTWGNRPPDLSDAIAKAKAAVAAAPRLVPIYSHRYVPTEPPLAGNPVLSVYLTDIIYYGTDLRRYFASEFGGLDHAAATRGPLRRVRFWSDLVEMTADLEQFLGSLNLTSLERRDGKGYDLAALARLEGPEREIAEAALLTDTPNDWRDIEALGVLRSPRALEAIAVATKSANFEVAVKAVDLLSDWGSMSPDETTSHLLRILPQVTIPTGLVVALRLAAKHPYPRVLNGLMTCALQGADGYARYYCGAVRLVLAGRAEHIYDPALPRWLGDLQAARVEDRRGAFRLLSELVAASESSEPSPRRIEPVR